jgi:hypothetical protein
MGEKGPENKEAPPKLETKPTDRSIPDKTAKAIGGTAIKNSGGK